MGEVQLSLLKIEEYKDYYLVDGIKVYWGFPLPQEFEAITLFDSIADYRSKEDLYEFLTSYWGQVMVNHEKIHMRQANSFKLRYFTFYVMYLWYWIIGLFKYKFNSMKSYENIPFEKEAYQNQQNFDYFKNNWKKYI